MENRICKNKKCTTVLPEDYKYKYCEHCRNQQVQDFKNGLKIVGSATCFAITIISAGKINFKK